MKITPHYPLPTPTHYVLDMTEKEAAALAFELGSGSVSGWLVGRPMVANLIDVLAHRLRQDRV